MSKLENRPVLFDYFPDLAEKLSWIRLETSPSPVQRLENLGHKNLWIKRDDQVSSVYGGNKVRRLEFILADVIRKGKKRIVTMGGIGTNHGLATAIYCKRLGIACTLCLFDQPLTPYVRQNLRLFYKYGAEMRYFPDMLSMSVDFYLFQRLLKRHAYFLYAGGSSPLGVVGAVNAAFELKRQIDAGKMPTPKYVFCPTASNGTMAGLILGFLLAGVPTTVMGVRVGALRLGPLPLNTPGTVKSMMEKTYRLLLANSQRLPQVSIPTPLMIHNYCGAGYGHPTPEGNRAVALFKERENIALEPVYTGKTCAAMLDFIKDSAHSGDTILYWHTFNSIDLSKEAASVNYHELPPVFHRFFEEE